MAQHTQAKTVSFRLGTAEWSMLAERAISEGDSIGQHARVLVRDALLDAKQLELERSLDELHQAIVTLRRDISVVLELILLNVASVPEEQVRDFVRAKLLGPS